jgi:antitoxin (DNA-binding transcriptional repressor) of toxin-antitoxin stability system
MHAGPWAVWVNHDDSDRHISEAEAQFDSLLDRVAQGEKFVIMRDGKSVARMIAENDAAITEPSTSEAPDPRGNT